MNNKNESCDSCMLMRKGDCGGIRGICEDYEYAYTIPEDERKLWPKVGERSSINVVKYKSKGSRLRGEFCYPKDRFYYSYDYVDHNTRRY